MTYIDNPTSYQNPKISVVIPVYNGSNYIREAIDSVLNQTYKNCEIIIVDDGSTDNTWEIIQSYGGKVRGFRKENGGVSTALNYAIDVMEGEWFAWLSHDDLWFPNKLECQMDYINANPNVMFCYSGLEIIDAENHTIDIRNGVWFEKGSDLRHMVLLGPYINGITVLIHRSCFDTCGLFREDLRCVQDGDMWLKIARIYDIGCISIPLAKSRHHSNQVGKLHYRRCRKEAATLLKHVALSMNASELFPQENKKLLQSSKSVIFKIFVYLWHCILSISIIYRLGTMVKKSMCKIVNHLNVL